MDYLKVRWIHEFLNEPVLLMSELDDDRYEVRKVEVFADGRTGFAGRGISSGGTILGEKPIPPALQIAADPQFVIEEFDGEGVEAAWHAAGSCIATSNPTSGSRTEVCFPSTALFLLL